MTTKELEAEYFYQLSLSQARRFYDEGLITARELEHFRLVMLQKYQPLISGLMG